MRKGVSLLRMSTAKEKRAHGCSLANADGCHGGGDVGHCIVDGKPSRYRAAWGIDVEIYGLIWSVGFEEEKLSND